MKLYLVKFLNFIKYSWSSKAGQIFGQKVSKNQRKPSEIEKIRQNWEGKKIWRDRMREEYWGYSGLESESINSRGKERESLCAP